MKWASSIVYAHPQSNSFWHSHSTFISPKVLFTKIEVCYYVTVQYKLVERAADQRSHFLRVLRLAPITTFRTVAPLRCKVQCDLIIQCDTNGPYPSELSEVSLFAGERYLTPTTLPVPGLTRPKLPILPQLTPSQVSHRQCGGTEGTFPSKQTNLREL